MVLLRGALAAAIDRCTRDLDQLARHGWGGKPVGIMPFLGDTHEGGQAVSILRAENGNSIVYKPRRATAGTALTAFLDGLHEQGVATRVRVPAGLRRDGYTWSAVVDGSGAPSPRAFGELLAVSWLLGAVDLHDENIVFTEDAVYILDDETMLSPGPFISPGVPQVGIDALICYSWAIGSSGLFKTLPTFLKGISSAKAALLCAAEDTFANLSRLASRGVLQKLLASFSTASLRVILRPTKYYDESRRDMDHPDWKSMTRNRLRAMTGGLKPSRALVDDEASHLAKGDIPIYYMTAKSSWLLSSEGIRFEMSAPFTAFERTLKAAELLIQRSTIDALMMQTGWLLDRHRADGQATGEHYLAIDASETTLTALLERSARSLLSDLSILLSADLPPADVITDSAGLVRVVPLHSQNFHGRSTIFRALVALSRSPFVASMIRHSVSELATKYDPYSNNLAMLPDTADDTPPWAAAARSVQRRLTQPHYLLFGSGDDLDLTDLKARWRAEPCRLVLPDPTGASSGIVYTEVFSPGWSLEVK